MGKSPRAIRRAIALVLGTIIFHGTLVAEPVQVILEMDESKPGAAIPADFLGFSYEKNVLALEHFRAENTVMVNLLRGLGGGTLRFGGNYVESTFWEPDGPKSLSRERSVLGTRELEEMYAFSRASGWPVIHGLNLGSNMPEMMADEAAAAMRIGKDSLLAFEIGNEPEHFDKSWRKGGYQYPDFKAEVQTYVAAMRARMPRVPLAGPATTSNFAWFTGFVGDFKGDAVMTTRHHYSLAASCTESANPRFATVENLLSPETAASWRKLLGQHQKASAAAGLPFRAGEVGSASGGGKEGVSDTFASALWTADYLFDLAAMGVAGVNFHGGFNCRGYTAFCAKKDGYHCHPGYYGMLFFSQAARARVLPVAARGSGVNLTAYRVLGGDGKTHVAMINKDLSADAVVTLAARQPRARVLRLAAPSVAAKDGVTLGGSAVAPDGTWKAAATESIDATGGKFSIMVPKASAALLIIGDTET